MTKETGSAIINAPVEEVFTFAKDIEKLWRTMGVTLRDVHQAQDGVGSTAHWTSRMFGVPVQGDIEFVDVVPNQRILAHSSTGPLFEFRFDPQTDGTTRLDVECDYHFNVPLVGDQIDAAYARLSRDWMSEWLTRVKTQVEGGELLEEPGGRLSRSIIIDAPVEAVFDRILDLGRFYVLFPDVAVRDVVLTPEGVGSSLRIYTHEFGLHVEGVAKIVEVVHPERIVVQVAFGRTEKPLWTFTFEPVEGGTKLVVEGEWHVRLPAIGHPMETLIARSHEAFADEMLANLKTEMEGTA